MRTHTVDGGTLFTLVQGHLEQYISYPNPHASTIHTVWIAHAWLVHAGVLDTTPRLAFLSAEHGSGKTIALEFTSELTPNSLPVIDISPSALFRMIEEEARTVLIDEVDNLFNRKTEDYRELLGLLNNGYRQSGTPVYRVEGTSSNRKPVSFNVFSPAVFAGLDNLPATLASRTLAIRMRKALPSERPPRHRRRKLESVWADYREKLKTWSEEVTPRVSSDFLDEAYEKLPESFTNRDAELAEIMVATAMLASDEWVDATIKALDYLHKEEQRNSKAHMGTLLLADIRAIFNETGREWITLADLTVELHGREESPWLDYRNGNAISKHQVSSLLKTYDIKTEQKRIGGGRERGYTPEMFTDAFARYLPPEDSPD